MTISKKKICSHLPIWYKASIFEVNLHVGPQKTEIPSLLLEASQELTTWDMTKVESA